MQLGSPTLRFSHPLCLLRELRFERSAVAEGATPTPLRAFLLALTAGARIMHQSSALVDQEVPDGLRPQKEKGAKVKARVTAIMLVSPYRRSFQICWAG